MMPNADEIASYDIYDPTRLYRKGGQMDTKIFALGPDLIMFDLRWKPFRSTVVQWIERHFTAACENNAFILLPTPIADAGEKPVVDEYTLGSTSASMLKYAPDEIAASLTGPGHAYIGLHVTRSRLELWRQASLDDRPANEIEALWERFLEAEVAMAASWPGFEVDYLITQEQMNNLPRY